MPLGADVDIVPYPYRWQYVDGPNSWDRYSDGYVYEVDPTTRLIAAAREAAQQAARLLQPASFAELPGWAQDDHASALAAFVLSCEALANREAWRNVCAAARPTASSTNWPDTCCCIF